MNKSPEQAKDHSEYLAIKQDEKETEELRILSKSPNKLMAIQQAENIGLECDSNGKFNNYPE